MTDQLTENKASAASVSESGPSMNQVLETFLQKTPEGDRGKTLLLLHARQVLEATNLIRQQIEAGELDNLSAEAAFHHIHRIHVGDNPLVWMAASADFGTATSDYEQVSAVLDAAHDLEGDDSFEEGRYRNKAIPWSQERGILGIHEADLAVFAKEYFSTVQSLVDQAKSGKKEILTEANVAPEIAITAATIIDLAHFKLDGNGRASEDFAVWLQRQLTKGRERPIALCDNGLRARGLHSLVREEYQDSMAKQRHRIDGRNELVLAIRRQLFKDLAQELGLTETKLDELLGFSFEVGQYQEKELARKKATPYFYDLLRYLKDWTRIYDSPFQRVANYFREKGVRDYSHFKADEVFVPLEN